MENDSIREAYDAGYKRALEKTQFAHEQGFKEGFIASQKLMNEFILKQMKLKIKPIIIYSTNDKPII